MQAEQLGSSMHKSKEQNFYLLLHFLFYFRKIDGNKKRDNYGMVKVFVCVWVMGILKLVVKKHHMLWMEKKPLKIT